MSGSASDGAAATATAATAAAAAAAASVVSASDWMKGIGLSVAASIIGGASKLAIRKSWLLEERLHHVHVEDDDNDPIQENGDFCDTTSTGNGAAATVSSISSGGSSRLGAIDSEAPITHRVHHPTTTAAVDTSGAYTLQHTNSIDSTTSRRHHSMRPVGWRWWPLTLRMLGMFGMTVLNPLCCVLAMNYASPSILAPFSGLTLVWIVLLSQPLIGEQPTHQQVMAAALIVLGEVIVAVFGDHTNDEGVTVSDVRQSYKSTAFLMFIALATAWFLVLARTILYTNSAIIRRFAWGVSGGSITGFQNFLKDTLTIVKATSDRPQERPWLLLIFLIAMAIATAFGGLLLLTACMKRYDATYSSAMFVGSFVVAASIMSAVHYDTLDHLDGVANMILYPVGLVVLMSGVYMLIGTSPAHTTVPEQERVGDDDDASPRRRSNEALLTAQRPDGTEPH